MTKNVLVIDDDYKIRLLIKNILEREKEEYKVYEAGNWQNTLKLLKEVKIDVILLDVCLPQTSGIEILKMLKDEHKFIEVILISGYGTIDLAVKSIKEGAFDFISKPFSNEKLLTILANAFKLKSLKEENDFLKGKVEEERIDFIGNSKAIQDVNEQLEQASRTDAWIFISGASGTGKEMAAQRIHYNSKRWQKPFIRLNCASFNDELIESELFGHEKGAFTGAVSTKKGQLELANEGTLFLDEVTDISLSTQAKLLRILQDMELKRLGGTESLRIDIRVISSTSKDISEEIKVGTFREDLYYRLHVIPVEMPSLKERKTDIIPLMEYYLKLFAKQNNVKPKILRKSAIDILKRHSWKGNVRELKNLAQRLSILIESKDINVEAVKLNILMPQEKLQESISEPYEQKTLKEAKEAFERLYLHKKLKDNAMNISKTANNLCVERSTLHKKIKKYNIENIKT